MQESHRCLNERLIKALVSPGGVHPQRFPDLVRLEKVAPVKQDDTGQVSWIIGYIRCHTPILPSPIRKCPQKLAIFPKFTVAVQVSSANPLANPNSFANGLSASMMN